MTSRAPPEVVELDDGDSVVSLNTTEDESPVPAATTARRAPRGGIRRRTTAQGSSSGTATTAAAARRRQAAANIPVQSIVDLCSPMGPPINGVLLQSAAAAGTGRARVRAAPRRAAGGRRGGRGRSTSSDEYETINLDNSMAELVSAGTSRAATVTATQPSSSLDTTTLGGPSCPICLCSWTSPVSTLCGHIFCKACIAQWVKQTKTCPVCKAGAAKLKTHPIFIS